MQYWRNLKYLLCSLLHWVRRRESSIEGPYLITYIGIAPECFWKTRKSHHYLQPSRALEAELLQHTQKKVLHRSARQRVKIASIKWGNISSSVMCSEICLEETATDDECGGNKQLELFYCHYLRSFQLGTRAKWFLTFKSCDRFIFLI